MKGKNLLKYILLLLCYLVLAGNLFITISYLFFDYTVIGILVATIFYSIAPFLVLMYIIPTVIIIRLQFLGEKKSKKVWIVLGICGFLLVPAYLPLFTVGFRIADIEYQMHSEYGAAYLNLDTSNMKLVPFSLWDVFTGGNPIEDSLFEVQTDVEYRKIGQDRLYFDYYSPTRGTGPFPVLITFHGGAWLVGDKGSGSAVAFNHYFASKGFAVFDVQYGVYDLEKAIEGLVPPDLVQLLNQLLGSGFGITTPDYNNSYTLQQQVENVGNFTHHIAINNATYNIDLNNAFLMGRSAGGLLALTVALGYNNSLFFGNFSSDLNVRGTISYYGCTDLPKMKATQALGRLVGLPFPLSQVISDTIFDGILNGTLPLEDQYDKLSPSFLIGNTSLNDIPPIMLVHGEKDNLCPYIEQMVMFQLYAKQLSTRCLLVTIPAAGHSFDRIVPSYGGQMAYYYVERFLALEMDS